MTQRRRGRPGVLAGRRMSRRDFLKVGGAGLAGAPLIGGDVIWPAQFAANGYILDLSDRFTEDMRAKFLEGPVASNTYEDKVWGVPWFTDAGLLYYRRDWLENSGFSGPPRTWEEPQET